MDPTTDTLPGVVVPLAYSPQEAADALRCSRGLIYSLMDTGQLRSVKLGRRRFIPASAIAEKLNEAA
jgi:excisionase family DNA binding protein